MVPGVKIGTIKRISFAPDASVVVQMAIEEKVQQYIPQDAKVKIGTDGLIGNKIVVVYGGTQDAPRIADNTRLTVETTVSSEDIMTILQANNQNLLAITNDFKTISERLASGKGSLGKLLSNETVYNDLQATIASLKQATGNARNITQDVSGYTAKLQANGTFANSFVTDTVIFTRLKTIVSQVNDVAVKANGIMNNLDRVSAQVSNTNTPAGALLNDEEMATDLKATLKNLQAASAKLDDNMEALQHNFLLRGFFRKKARQEKLNNQVNNQ
jgi:phospholipid/cholesterol/gamma-HCH transport system substrate-binding protein